ncbi:MAG: DNA polymerase III subunit beta [Caldivirga sp. MG_3]|jgi:hypothetical protein|nr:MAG: DNA polymerase III subunit beta [Caldivirga sp. MG_3]
MGDEGGLSRLGSFPWRDYGVVFSLLFGSRLSGRLVKGDWDVAVWLEDVNAAVDLQWALARHLGVREWDVDLVVLNNHEDLPCTLIIDILGKGRVIYYRDLETYLDIKARLLHPCLDFMLDAEKLQLLKVQMESVMRRWVH